MSDAGQATVPGAVPTVPGGAGGNGATAPWWDGFDDLIKGTMQNTGLDKLEPAAAAAKAVQMFRDTQAKLGLPADRVLRLPADPADMDGWKAVHRSLGVPETADGYDFSTVKMPDGKPLEDDLVAFLKTTSQALAIPKDRAPRLAEALVKLATDNEAMENNVAAIQNGEARLRLQQNWGPNAPVNKFVADRTAAMLALPPELMALIEKSPAYDTIMEGLRAASERMGEGGLIGGGGGVPNAITTRDGANARIEELKHDKAWYARWEKGDADAVKEWSGLMRIARG